MATHAPNIMLIAGPSGSGKSTLAMGLAGHLESIGMSASVMALDHYYRDLRHLNAEEHEAYDFDRPEAWELERLVADVRELKAGGAIEMPEYDFQTRLRRGSGRYLQGGDWILMEGLFALCVPGLDSLADLKVFVEIDDAMALERRIFRDEQERGRDRKSVETQYATTVRPANRRFILPSAARADVTVSGDDSLASQIRAIEPHLKLDDA